VDDKITTDENTRFSMSINIVSRTGNMLRL